MSPFPHSLPYLSAPLLLFVCCFLYRFYFHPASLPFLVLLILPFHLFLPNSLSLSHSHLSRSSRHTFLRIYNYLVAHPLFPLHFGWAIRNAPGKKERERERERGNEKTEKSKISKATSIFFKVRVRRVDRMVPRTTYNAEKL